ncbi:hypothetical protein ACFL96_06130 [Thermoproteota archaeon]
MTKSFKKTPLILITILIFEILFFDIPITQQIEKCGVTVKYNHFVFNKFLLDIFTMDHAPQNSFIKGNAERELHRKLCDNYIKTKDEETKEAILEYFNSDSVFLKYFKSNYPEKEVSIESICEGSKYIFGSLWII